MESSKTNRSITSKSQMHGIWTALYPLWQFAILKAPNQWAITVWPIIDIKKIIIWFYTEAREQKTKEKCQMQYALPNIFTFISLNLKFTITVLIKGKKIPPLSEENGL